MTAAQRLPDSPFTDPCPAHQATEPVTQDADGVWHVHDPALARELLLSPRTRQAGFGADAVRSLMTAMGIRVSMIYQDGQAHREQRRETAHSFRPSTVSGCYADPMRATADRIAQELRARRQADVAELSLTMTVEVAAGIVGLNQSKGLVRRLGRFLPIELAMPGWRPREILAFCRWLPPVTALFVRDVLPSIRARRRVPREDLISRLVQGGASRLDILSDVITYAVGGMETPREFMCVAMWHLLDDAELRERYQSADTAERHRILREILRVNPVVRHLQRRAAEDITLNGTVRIPAGALINVHVHTANRTRTDEDNRIEVIGFGYGPHRCAGEHVAVQESDIFLQALLDLPGLRIVRRPDIGWSDLVTSYELRNFIVAVD